MTRIIFSPRDDVLEPAAVAGTGPAARALAARLMLLSADQLGKLRGCAGSGIVAVLGEAKDLPWADGVTYLGRDPAAPRLLIPTMLRPDAAMDVLERAIARRAAGLPGPWAVLTPPPRLFSMADAAILSRSHLAQWLEAQP
jgi:MoxR-vWA-beta-propeller ternary system domain bpX5